MSRNPLEETPDGLFLGLLFHAGRKQFRQGNVQGFGDSSQKQDRDVSLTGLQLRQMPLRNVGFLRYHFASHAAAITKLSNARADEKQKLTLANGSAAPQRGRLRSDAGRGSHGMNADMQYTTGFGPRVKYRHRE